MNTSGLRFLDATDKAPLIRLKDARRAPCVARGRGKPVNLGTIYRWIHDGVCGVQLETYWAGELFTTVPALERFIERVTAARTAGAASTAAPASVAPAKSEDLEMELDRMGI